MNNFVCMSFHTCETASLDKSLKVGISGSNWAFVILRDIDELASREAVKIYKIYTPTAACENVCFPSPHRHRVLLNFRTSAEWKLKMASLTLSALEHLFICLRYICISMSWLFIYFVHFKIGFLVFSSQCVGAFYRWGKLVLCDMSCVYVYPLVCLLILFK